MCPEQEIIDRNGRDVSVFEQGRTRLELDRDLAVKKYKRAAAGQKMNAKEVRPPHVLRRTLLYLCDNVLDQEGELLTVFDFVSDRFRAIRQDYLCQAQDDELCLASFETMLRFHIMMLHELSIVEMGTLNVSKLTQTMTSLMRWYSDARAAGKPEVNEAEFRAYQLLFYMFDRTKFMLHLTEMPAEIRKSEQVKFATRVYLAKQECNYIRFFQLVREATYLQACCMHSLFNEIRTGALRRMVVSYKGKNVPLSTLSRSLLFESEQEAREFFTFYGVPLVKGKTELVDFMSLAGTLELREQAFPRSLSSVISKKRPPSLREAVLPLHDPRLRKAAEDDQQGSALSLLLQNKPKPRLADKQSSKAQNLAKLDEAQARQDALDQFAKRQPNRPKALTALTAATPPPSTPLSSSSSSFDSSAFSSAFGIPNGSNKKAPPIAIASPPPKSANPFAVGPSPAKPVSKVNCDALVTKALTAANKAQSHAQAAEEAQIACDRVARMFAAQQALQLQRQRRVWEVWRAVTKTRKDSETSQLQLASRFRAQSLCKWSFAMMREQFTKAQERKADQFMLRKWFRKWRKALRRRNKRLALFTAPDLAVSSLRTSFTSPFEKLRVFGHSSTEMDLTLDETQQTATTLAITETKGPQEQKEQEQEEEEEEETNEERKRRRRRRKSKEVEWDPLDLARMVGPVLRERNPDFESMFFNLAVSLPSSSKRPSTASSPFASPSSASLPPPISLLTHAAGQWVTKKLSSSSAPASSPLLDVPAGHHWTNQDGLQSLVVVAEGRALQGGEARGLQGLIFLLSVELEGDAVPHFAAQVKKADEQRLRALVESLHPLSSVPLLVLYTLSEASLSTLRNKAGAYEAIQSQVSEALPASLALPRSLASRISDSNFLLLVDPSAVPFSSPALSAGVGWLASSAPAYPRLGSLAVGRMLDQHAGLYRDYLRESEEGSPKLWVEAFNQAVQDVLALLQSSCADASWPPLVPAAFAPELPDRWWDTALVRKQVSSLLLPEWPFVAVPRALPSPEAWALWQQYLSRIPPLASQTNNGILAEYFVSGFKAETVFSEANWATCMECLFSQRLSLFRESASSLRVVCPLSVPVVDLLSAAFSRRKRLKKQPQTPPITNGQHTQTAPQQWVDPSLVASVELERDLSLDFRSRLAETEQQLNARHQQLEERQQRKRRKRRQREKTANNLPA